MKHQQHEWKTKDGLTIKGQSWEPDAPPKAVLVLVHGMGEHCSRYDNLINPLLDAGFAVFSEDHRGHGRSEGKRGHTPSYQHLMDDVRNLLAQSEARFPDLPRFMLGHSMGGNLVINYMLRFNPDLKGAIATGAMLKLAFDPPAIKMALGKLVKNILPTYTESTNLDSKELSRDQAVVDAYVKDPLVHDKITTGFYFATMDAADWALQNGSKLKHPMLVMHGGADGLTAASGSEAFCAQAPKELITCKIWDGFYHELHNEPEKAEVIAYLVDWMNQQL